MVKQQTCGWQGCVCANNLRAMLSSPALGPDQTGSDLEVCGVLWS